jgi:hypothetical protein
MKKILTLFLLGMFLLPALAQEDEGIKVLFGRDTKVRGFIGPVFELTEISGDFTGLAGVSGGVLLDNFYLGGYGAGLNENTQNDKEVKFSYGGLLVGYGFMTDRTFHPSLSLAMGMGTVSSLLADPFPDDNVYVLSPIIELEVNFTRFLKMSIGATYRMVGGISDEGAGDSFSNSDFSGPSGIIALRFGWFD